LGRPFGGAEYDFNFAAREAVRTLCVAMESELQHYMSSASLDDFIESLRTRVSGGYRPVVIKVGEIDAELSVTMIDADQPLGDGSNYIDFSAWMFFRTGPGPHVHGRFTHAWHHDDTPRGSIYVTRVQHREFGPRQRR